jgi:hypothetical protein
LHGTKTNRAGGDARIANGEQRIASRKQATGGMLDSHRPVPVNHSLPSPYEGRGWGWGAAKRENVSGNFILAAERLQIPEADDTIADGLQKSGPFSIVRNCFCFR